MIKDVQGTDRQHGQEQWRRHLCRVEGGRVQEGQVVVEQVKVRLQQAVERVQAGQVECLEERILAVVLLDVLVDPCALLF